MDSRPGRGAEALAHGLVAGEYRTIVRHRGREGGAQMERFAVVVADASGVIQSWNSEAQRLFGYPADDAVGQTLDLLVPEDYRDAHWAAFHAVMKGTDITMDRGAVRVPVRHQDGSVEHCAVRLVALADPWDRPVGAIAVFVGQEPAGEGLPALPEL
jgi:PAS domain S-box-containing protein